MTMLPIELRVPNPTERHPDALTELLTTHLRAHRVARVVAPDRAPTDLTLWVLDQGFAAERDRGLYLRLAGDLSLAPALHALAQLGGVELQGALLTGEGPAAEAALVDLADERGGLVVVDGVSPRTEVWRRALDVVARYSRRARWVFIEVAGDETNDGVGVFRVEPSLAVDRCVSELGDEARRLVSAVAMAGRLSWHALPAELRAVGAELARNGWVEDRAGFWTTHHSVEPELEQSAALLLVDLDPQSLLAAGEVLIRHGHDDRLLERLTTERDQLIESGAGLATWRLLGMLTSRRARSLRLAIAARVHAPRVLDETTLVEAPSVLDRFHYAQVLVAANRVTEAIAQMDLVLEAEADDDMRLFLAQCHMARSEPEAARHVLDGMTPADPTLLFRRDVLLVGSRQHEPAPQVDDALDDLLVRVVALRGPHATPARLDLARALHLAGRIRDGLSVLDTDVGVGRFLYGKTEAEYLLGLLLTAGGRPVEAERIVRRLAQAADIESFGGQHTILLLATVLTDLGRLDEAIELLLELREHTALVEYRPLRHATELRLATALVERDGVDRVAVQRPTGDDPHTRRLVALASEIEVRRGLDPASAASSPVLDMIRNSDESLADVRARAQRQIDLGGMRAAVGLCRRAALIAVCSEHPDTEVLLSQWIGVAQKAQQPLEEAIASFAHRAWTGRASFDDIVGQVSQPFALGRLAAAVVAPGDEVDRLYAAIASAIARRTGFTVRRLRAGHPWWIDAIASRVVFVDRVVDLHKSAVRWAIIEHLALHPDGASKAALIEAVWGISDHHPLEDENRLRMAVFKLRKQLDDDEALLIETTEDGYRVGSGALVVSSSTSAQTSL